MSTFSKNNFRKIKKVDLSGDSSIEFTDLLSSVLMYQLVITDLQFSSDNSKLLLRTSTDNGVSYDAGASDYAFTIRFGVSGSASNGESQSGAATAIEITQAAGNDTNENGSHLVEIFDPSNTKYTHVSYRGSQIDTAGDLVRRRGNGVRLDAGAINAIQLLPSAGTLSSGTISLYSYLK